MSYKILAIYRRIRRNNPIGVAHAAIGRNLNLVRSIPLALTWFYLHVTPSDLQNILMIGVVVSTLVSLSDRRRLFSLAKMSSIWFPLGLMFLLGLTASALAGGDGHSFRLVILISLVIVLGVLSIFQNGLHSALWGLTLGASAVAFAGLFRHITGTSVGLNIFDDRYAGLRGLESYDTLNSVVGLVAVVGLITNSVSRAVALTLPALLLGVTLILADLTAGLISLGVLLISALAMKFLMLSPRPALGKYFLAVLTGLGILAILLLSQMRASIWLASFVGEEQSVEARFQIWNSVFSVMEPIGWTFGHGTFFWAQGSSKLVAVHERFSDLGLPAFGHSHNSFLDFFVALGLAGVFLGSFLIWTYIRHAIDLFRDGSNWTSRASAWLFLLPLLTLALSESAIVHSANGWLLVGLLIGGIAVHREFEAR